METIKILRLKSGEDIITYFEQVDRMNIILRNPMVVLVKNDTRSGRQIIMMDNWLPVPLIKTNEAFITEQLIVTAMEPSVEFSEYFENAVLSFNKMDEEGMENLETDNSEMSTETIHKMFDLVGPDTSMVH